MVSQKEMDYTYTFIDKIFRLSFGEMGCYSGAMYNGDFSLSLEQAQKQKHEFIINNLNIVKGSRVLDMGCGWGPFLKCLKDMQVKGIGVTLSHGQAESCNRNGLDVHLMDCRSFTPETFGTFDSVVCIGAFESFCSVQEWRAGKQDVVYHDFFKRVYDLLPVGARFYMQTGIFGKNMIDIEDIDIHADRNSDEYLCALMVNEYPNSWLPYSKEQILECAKPYFRLISLSNGRLDYIETMKQWHKRFLRFNFKKYTLFLSFFAYYLKNTQFRHRVAMLRKNANQKCFEREILDHFRFVFEKVVYNANE